MCVWLNSLASAFPWIVLFVFAASSVVAARKRPRPHRITQALMVALTMASYPVATTLQAQVVLPDLCKYACADYDWWTAFIYLGCWCW